jgi:phage repressor protein C with HTH and peptisase S24 domain
MSVHTSDCKHSYGRSATYSYDVLCNDAYMKEEFGSILNRLRKDKGLSQEDVAKAIGVSRVAVSKWESGDTENVKHANLSRLSRLFGISIDDLLSGSSTATFTTTEDLSVRSDVRPIIEWSSPDDLPDGEYVIIPRFDVHVSAGNGHVIYEEIKMAQGHAYRTEFIKRNGLYARNLIAIYAKGSSMEPRIRDGDSLLVDRAQTSITDGSVYVVSYAGEVRVKRLQRRPDGGLVIVSDNKHGHADVQVSIEDLPHIHIIGKVIEVSGPP